jgi:hypothetical protein
MFRRGSPFNPYDQSILKGDYPIFGQHVFMILSATSATLVQQQRRQSLARPSAAQLAQLHATDVKLEALRARLSAEILKGAKTGDAPKWFRGSGP